jgi:hypothetical protein
LAELLDALGNAGLRVSLSLAQQRKWMKPGIRETRGEKGEKESEGGALA